MKLFLFTAFFFALSAEANDKLKPFLDGCKETHKKLQVEFTGSASSKPIVCYEIATRINKGEGWHLMTNPKRDGCEAAIVGGYWGIISDTDQPRYIAKYCVN